MSMPALLASVVDALNRAQIAFMLTGSMAAAWHGAGRATLDIDLVIDPRPDQIGAFLAAIAGPELYVSEAAAREAIADKTMFNVVDTATGWKVDLIIRKSRPFSRVEFDRRQPMDFDGLQLWVTSLEDLIVAKLEWAKLGNSARQVEDVSAMLRIAGRDIDAAYLERWIDALDLQQQWQIACHGQDTA